MSELSPRRAAAPAPGERIELRIPASTQWVRVARLTVAGVASRLHFSIDAVEDIKLAVAEAINNAIQHASVAPGDEATVTITLQSDGDGLWICVADQGRLTDGLNDGLNGAASQTPATRPDDELPEGGLGMLLIGSLMDEVSHESGTHADTVVKMFKRLPPRLAQHA